MAVRESAVQRVQRTCEEALAASTDVKIDADAVQALAAELPAATAVAAACQFMRLPIRFDSLQAEVNAMAIFHLLDFGSGFDAMLLAKTGRDAREVVQFGLLGMLMHGAALESAHWLREFSGYQVFQFFNVDASVDEAVPGLPGVVLTSQGPLGAFTNKLREVMSETGQILGDSGHASLGALILANLDAQVAAGQPPRAAPLVEELADTLAAFDDKGLYHSKQVYFYRKAQLLAAQLHLRFRGADARFRFADMGDLAVDSGNVLPAVFRRAGVLQLAEGLASAVDAGTDLQGDERERALRAAAVVAGRRICDAAAAAAGGGESGGAESSAIQPWQLSMYLLSQEEQRQREGQEGEGQQAAGAAGGQAGAAARHVAKGTVAY